MKYIKAAVHCKTDGLPALRCEDSQLTSFSAPHPHPSVGRSSGAQRKAALLLQPSHRQPVFGHATLVLCLVLDLMLGYRRLCDMHYYSDDPVPEKGSAFLREIALAFPQRPFIAIET